jgi:hypothetical protein
MNRSAVTVQNLPDIPQRMGLALMRRLAGAVNMTP